MKPGALPNHWPASCCGPIPACGGYHRRVSADRSKDMSRIVLDAVSKQFPDGTAAVKSLDLDVSDGELLVLVGPSGCGKTTALRMVAGLEEVTSGTIFIDGSPVNDLEPRHRDVAMVFQSYALYPHLSAFQNMAFSLKYRHVPKAEVQRRVDGGPRKSATGPLLHPQPPALSRAARPELAGARCPPGP